MKIRNLFTILLIGIVVVPLLLFCLAVLVFHYRTLGRPFVSELENVEILDTEAKTYINEYLQELPWTMNVIAMETSGKVVYSEIEGVPVGTVFGHDTFISLARQDGGKYVYAWDNNLKTLLGGRTLSPDEPFPFDESDLIFFLIRVDAARDSGPMHLARAGFLFTAGISGVIFVFSVIMSILILRSVTRSIIRLSESVRRLESGNFDDEIQFPASNEIMILAGYLDSMRKEMKDSKTRRARFLMGLSHDLRTPIALIKGYTEAIRDGMADDPAMLEKSLGIIDSKITQLENLLNGLIESFKMENSEWKGNLDECPLLSFFTAYAARISQDANLLGRHVTARIDIPANLRLEVDVEMLTRFLENIVTNAFRYTQEGGMIAFEVRWADAAALKESKERKEAKKKAAHELDGKAGRLEIAVSDNGCGIAEKDLPFIFDPFYRGTNSRREEGYGFGLATVKYIADAYGWTLNVESREGKGTAFTAWIYDCTPGD